MLWKATLIVNHHQHNNPVFLYWLILGVGNTATTLLAVSPVQRLFNSSIDGSNLNSTASLETKPLSAISRTQSEIQTLPSTSAKTESELPELSGAIWFWYAFIGVFGFEILLKNINLTFANVGVLSINDWISKALDNASASAIESQANSDTEQAQILADRLKTLPTQELNAHVLNFLGQDRLQELHNIAQQNGAEPNLTKALALAYEAYDKAKAI